MEQRTCKRSGCDNTFETYASRDKQYCSRSCSTKSQWEKADDKKVQEWREKISKGVREADYKPAEYWEGKSLPEETRQKMSEAHKGKEKSEEHKKKISEALKGKDKSKEHKENLSKALEGRKNDPKKYAHEKSEETKKKISEALSGRSLTKKHKQNISEAMEDIAPFQGSVSKLERNILSEVEDMTVGEVEHWRKVSGYYPDIVYRNLVIEVFGDYWHANPEKYNPKDKILSKGEKKKASDIWEKDKQRISNIKSEGYEVFVIWESEWKQNKKKVLDNISDRVKEL